VNKRTSWLKKLVSLGLRPEIIVLEECDRDRLSDAEMEWIAAARAAWCPLTNGTEGGEGAIGRKLSDTTKNLIGMANKGRHHSPEARAQMSASRKGRSLSQEHKRNLRISRFGNRPFEDDTGKVWETFMEAAAFWGLFPQLISAVLSGQQKSTGGRRFRYLGSDWPSRESKPRSVVPRRSIRDELGRVYKNQKEAARQLGVGRELISKVLCGRRKTCGGHVVMYVE
jgi:hypothetical protein